MVPQELCVGLVHRQCSPHELGAHYLAWEIRIPVVVGEEVPAKLHGAPAGAASVGDDLSEALRSLLVQALNPAPMLPGVPQVSRAAGAR